MLSNTRSLATRTIERRILVDRVRVTGPRATGEPTMDPVTLALTWPRPAELYDGPGGVRRLASSNQITDGQELVEADEVEVKIPAWVAGVRPGALVMVRDSQEPDLIGVELVVRSAEAGSLLLTRRLVCLRVQALPTTASPV
jgi:hypothetical protein